MRRLAVCWLVVLVGLAGCGRGDVSDALGSSDCGDDHGAGLVGIEPATGKVRFTVPVDGMLNDHAVTTEGTVFAAAGDGQVGAYDASTGALRWCADQEGLPEVVAGDVVVVSDSGTLVALERASGARRWKRAVPVNRTGEASPLYGPNVLSGRGWIAVHTGVMVAPGTELVGLDPADGTVRWTRPAPPCSGSGTPGTVSTAPPNTPPTSPQSACVAGGESAVATDGTSVYFSEPNAGTVVAVDGRTGTERWQHEHDSRVVGLAGAVVVTTDAGNGGPRALDVGTGDLRWADESVRFTTVVAARTPVSIEQRIGVAAPAPAPTNRDGTPMPSPPSAAAAPRAGPDPGPEGTVVRGYDPDSGALRWTTEVPRLMFRFGVAGPLVLLGGSEDLAAVDSETGELVWLVDHPNLLVTGRRPSPSGYMPLGGDGDGIVGFVTAAEAYRD